MHFDKCSAPLCHFAKRPYRLHYHVETYTWTQVNALHYPRFPPMYPYVREELFYLQIEAAEQLIDGAPMDKHLEFFFILQFFFRREWEKTFIWSNQ